MSLLLSHALNEKVTLGAGVKYSYTFDKYRSRIDGFGERFTFASMGEFASTDDALRLGYHRVAPVLGIKFVPSAMFALDVSVEAGAYFGEVRKDTSLYQAFDFLPFLRPPQTLYTEDFDSHDLSGWDVAVRVNPEFTLSERLSVPVMVAFNYRDLRWAVNGVSGGDFEPLFMPWNYLEVSLIDGFVTYEDAITGWDIMGGAGVKYRADWGTLAGFAAYTHRDTRNTYSIDDQSGFPGEYIAFTQRDKEIKDVLSLGVVFEKEFSPMLAADLGVQYDLGWGHRSIYTTLASPFEAEGPFDLPQLLVEADDRDIYQDLTLTTHLTIKPMDRLSVALGGMVRIPLDTLDYDMSGSASGLEGALLPAPRPGYFFNGPFSMGYESSGWDWGGLLSVTYEFGCPTATPPAAPAPVIEPKIEPMSFK